MLIGWQRGVGAVVPERSSQVVVFAHGTRHLGWRRLVGTCGEQVLRSAHGKIEGVVQRGRGFDDLPEHGVVGRERGEVAVACAMPTEHVLNARCADGHIADDQRSAIGEAVDHRTGLVIGVAAHPIGVRQRVGHAGGADVPARHHVHELPGAMHARPVVVHPLHRPGQVHLEREDRAGVRIAAGTGEVHEPVRIVGQPQALTDR